MFQLGCLCRKLWCRSKEIKLILNTYLHTFVGDVLATVLALYMHDKHQPLPSHEEVLICTPETTAEEVSVLQVVQCVYYFPFYSVDTHH